MGATRLDVVVWYRGKQEEKARQLSAEAKAAEEAAKTREEAARLKLMQDHRTQAQAQEWEVAEMARSTNVRKLKEAIIETKKASAVAVQKKELHVKAAQGLKAVSNAAAKLAEQAKEEEKRKEARQFDELAMMLGR